MGVKGKYFVNTSKNDGWALDIKGGQAYARSKVIIWDGRDNQVWFQEPITSTIRTKLNQDLHVPGYERRWLSVSESSQCG